MLNRFQPKGQFIYLKQSVSKWMLRIGKSFNPLTPMSDQDRISPYNINTISTR